MNKSPEEQKILDEKIARIRKQNEEIIRKKKVIDEEIQSARLESAIVDTKKPYDVDSAGPTLYSDTISSNHPTKSIVYPKVEVKNATRRNANEDAAWRQERAKIDNDRIRRQKADTGWRREWDADKSLDENQRRANESGPNDGCRPAERKSYHDDRRDNRNCREDAIQRSNWRNSNDNMSWENHQSKTTHEDNWRDNCKSRINCEDGLQDNRKNIFSSSNNTPARLQFSQSSSRSNLDQREGDKNFSNPKMSMKNIEVKCDEGTIPQQRKILNKSTVRSALNLNQNRVVGPSSIVGTSAIKVTEYSKTKSNPTLLEDNLWKKEKGTNKEFCLTDRLKNMVIHVNTVNDMPKRVIEIVDESKSKSKTENENSSGMIKTLTFENSNSKNDTRVMEPIKSQTFSNSTNLPVQFEDLKISFDASFSSNRVSQTSGKPLVGILKKSPEPSPTFDQKGFNFDIDLSLSSKEETKQLADETIKKSPAGLSPRVKFVKEMPKKEDLKVVDGNEEEWEDVSDDDWTDASGDD